VHLPEEVATLHFRDLRFGRAIGDRTERIEAGETEIEWRFFGQLQFSTHLLLNIRPGERQRFVRRKLRFILGGHCRQAVRFGQNEDGVRGKMFQQ
jgi:hypothetical protein